MRVKSAVGTLFKAIIVVAIVMMVSAAVLTTALTWHDTLDLLINDAAVLAMAGLLIWLLFGTYYELRPEYLYCRSGPFFEKIRYDKIKYLGLTENFLSSMALSPERIEIRQHGKGYIMGTTMISPENREDFLEKLKARCKNLDPNEK
ncbi:PH domain-containing protein [Oscillospiraceae bacterium CM]|nr:PH domain-containing protein [Oscillospiraceae bacterium CM]